MKYLPFELITYILEFNVDHRIYFRNLENNIKYNGCIKRLEYIINLYHYEFKSNNLSYNRFAPTLSHFIHKYINDRKYIIDVLEKHKSLSDFNKVIDFVKLLKNFT